MGKCISRLLCVHSWFWFGLQVQITKFMIASAGTPGKLVQDAILDLGPWHFTSLTIRVVPFGKKQLTPMYRIHPSIHPYMYMYICICIYICIYVYICVYWYSCLYFYWERDINIFNTIHTHIDVQYFCSLVRSWPPWVDLAVRFLFLRWPCRSLKIWLKPGPCDSWKWVFIVVERGNRHGMARLGFQPSPNRSFIIGLPKLNGKEMGNTSRPKKDNHFSAFFVFVLHPSLGYACLLGGYLECKQNGRRGFEHGCACAMFKGWIVYPYSGIVIQPL